MDSARSGRVPKHAESLERRRFKQQLALKNRALASTAEGITIADARQPDNPLIYANAGFERLTGYSVGEVLGRNCRFLQGPGTDQAALDKVRAAIREGRECTVQLLNYRKDGTTFWNRLSITPVRNSAGEVTHFIGVQSDVTEQKLAEEALQKAKQELEAANRAMKKDLEAAARVQQSLLPATLPKIAGTDFAWAFRPCSELAGDILNIFSFNDRQAGFYILDVSGHGVAAALLSVTLSRLLSPIPGQSFLYTGSPANSAEYRVARPVEVIERLSRQFPFDPRTSQYFTIFYGVLDAATGNLRYSSAGQGGSVCLPRESGPRILEPTGVPVGLLPEPKHEECELRMKPGDRLYLCTDGIVETENADGHEFGFERFVAAIDRDRRLTLNESLSTIMAAVEDWCGCSELSDDASMLAVEIQS